MKPHFEAQLAGGVALYDASGVLPQHKRKSYSYRKPDNIHRIYAHHSGAPNTEAQLRRLSGLTGLIGSARYVVDHKGWPGCPYTYWISFYPDKAEDNSFIVYRAQPDDVRSYHTGGQANGHGVSICFQGNLTSLKPSDAMIECAEALLPWCRDRYPALQGRRSTWLSWHSESRLFGGSGKKSCPGPHLEKWLDEYRKSG